MESDRSARYSSTRAPKSLQNRQRSDRLQHFIVNLVAIVVICTSLWSLRGYRVGLGIRATGIPSSYVIRSMGTLGCGSHDFTHLALNERGQLAGGSFLGNGYYAALDTDGRIVDLGVLPGFQSSRAYAINDKGQVAGSCYRTDAISYSLRPMRACLWQHGAIQSLPVLQGFKCSIARALNDLGQVVGSCYTPLNEQFEASCHAVLWKGSETLDLGVPPGFVQSSALAINNHGLVVGTLLTRDHQTRAFAWQDGKMVELPHLPGCDMCAASGVNDSDQIVGVSGTNPMHLVVWNNGSIRDLGVIPGSPVLDPVRINSDGEILLNAGTGSLRVGDYPRPYIWAARTGFVQLSALIGSRSGYNLWKALDLNNHGQIAAGGRYRGGMMQVYLLSPKHKAAV